MRSGRKDAQEEVLLRIGDRVVLNWSPFPRRLFSSDVVLRVCPSSARRVGDSAKQLTGFAALGSPRAGCERPHAPLPAPRPRPAPTSPQRLQAAPWPGSLCCCVTQSAVQGHVTWSSAGCRASQVMLLLLNVCLLFERRNDVIF